jgi:hypothetical protein
MMIESGDNLLDLEAAIPQLATALEQQHLGSALKRATEALVPIEYQISRFQALTTAAELLLDQLFSERSQLTEIIEDLEDVADLIGAAEDKTQLDLVAREFQRIVRAIASFHRIVLGGMERYTGAHLTWLGVLGKLLVRMGQNELGLNLQRLEEEARKLATNTNAQQLPAQIAAIKERRAQLQSEIKTLAKDPEVDAFLQTLGRGHTLLSSVTPAVLAWLGEHNALDLFRVSPA